MHMCTCMCLLEQINGDIGRAHSETWDFGVLMQDSGMGYVFAGHSSKNRDGW